MKTTTLITGAAGFIGSALTKRLELNSGAHVIKVSRRLGIDLNSPDWQERLPSAQIDTVVHLAQSTQYRDFPAGAADMVAVNISATLSLLEWARKNGVKRFIFASTGNVYKPSEQPWFEESPLEPTGFYGASKLAAEYLVKQYEKYFEVVIVRLFGVYGPGQTKMLIPNLVEKIKHEEAIQLVGGEGLVINPIHINDVAFFLERLIDCPLNEKITVLNVGGTERLNISVITKKLETALSFSAKFEEIEGKPTFFVGNITKLTHLFPGHIFVNSDCGLAGVCRDE